MFTVPSPAPENADGFKRKRRPAGTPDPDAEVVLLSPRTLMESDQYVCEICNQGFQREQNLQMHRRRHKVPWKLVKRAEGEAGSGAGRKRVFVCPEPSCLHHDPAHALGDLVGIKKHFRRKHSAHRQWACAKCSKAYAVQSDYKAHLKTCGTRGHSCDCGRVFSRVESFIEHQDACNASRSRADELLAPPPSSLSRTASSPSPSSDTNISTPTAWPAPPILKFHNPPTVFIHPPSSSSTHHRRNAELQLLPASGTRTAPAFPSPTASALSPTSDEARITKLQLSIGSAADRPPPPVAVDKVQLLVLAGEKASADDARQQAKRMMELAELEFANAKRIRQQAEAELGRVQAMRDEATKKVSCGILEITCQSCKRLYLTTPTAAIAMNSDETSMAASYMSSVVTEGERDDENRHHQRKKFDTCMT